MPSPKPDQKEYRTALTDELQDKRVGEILRALFPGLSSREVVMIVNNGLAKWKNSRVNDLDDVLSGEGILKVDLRHGTKGERKAKRKSLMEQMQVIDEDENFVVVSKAAGVIVQPTEFDTEKSAKPPLVELIKHYWKKQKKPYTNPILIQRLDKETSGLMVMGKNIPASRHLQRQAGGRSMERNYYALVEGRMSKDKGTWHSYLVDEARGYKHSALKVRPDMVVENPPENSKEAITHFTVLERYENATLLELKLETGRTHQIRIHCAESAHPIIGDRVYSKLAERLFPRIPFGENIPKTNRMMLHAFRLKFQHPKKDTRWMTFKDDPPKIFTDYQKLLETGVQIITEPKRKSKK